MRKPTICLCENKGADQLRSNCNADQRLSFRYTDSTIPLLFEPLAIFCDCTARFASDLFGNHIVGFPMRRLNYVMQNADGQDFHNQILRQKESDFVFHCLHCHHNV